MKYYVTFGQRFLREDHPVVPCLNPNGVMLVETEVVKDDFNDFLRSKIGDDWSNFFTTDDFHSNMPYYSLGVTHFFKNDCEIIFKKDNKICCKKI